MTKARRVGTVFVGLFLVLFGLSMMIEPNRVYWAIVLILGFTMLITGIRSLVYYLSMAKHMVGGRVALYRAIIILDLGLFTLSLTNVPIIFVVLYLAGIHGFSGAIDIMRAMEAKRLQAASWKMNLVHGIVNVVMAGLCLAFIGTVEVAVEIYAAGLVYSGIIRIIQAFRKTTVVYIQ